MKFVLNVEEDVYLELRDAVLYYEFRQSGLGERFFADWESTLEELSRHPLSFQVIQQNYRRISFEKFPYMLIYEVEGKAINIYKLIGSKMDERKRYRKR